MGVAQRPCRGLQILRWGFNSLLPLHTDFYEIFTLAEVIFTRNTAVMESLLNTPYIKVEQVN